MAFSTIIKLANHFKEKFAQQTSQTPEEIAAFNRMNKDLDAVVNGFLTRNPIKMITTLKPIVIPATTNQKQIVSAGFVITMNDFNNYLQKLNNEIHKLQTLYPNVTLTAHYDTKDVRKAKL